MIKLHRSKKNLLQYKPYCQIVDSDPTSKDYFRIQDKPTTLYVGKNLLKIFPNKNALVPNSTVFIEILDSNGEPLYHEILTSTTSDNSKYIVIYVYPDTPIGDATIVLCARAKYDNKTGNEIKFSNDREATNFKENINLIWTGRFSISSTNQNSSEIFYSKDPIIDFSERQVPYYEISSSNSNKINLYSTPSSSFSMRSITQPFQNATDISVYADKFTDMSRKLSIDPILNSDGSGTTRELIDIPRHSDLSTIYASGFTFIPEMEGGILYANNIDISDKTPSDTANPAEFSVKLNYSASIVKVLNANTIQVDKPFIKKMNYTTATGEEKQLAISAFTNHINATASYYRSNNLKQTPATESFISFLFRDAEPDAGTVDKIHIKYKAIGSFGESVDVGEFQITEQNLFVDDNIILQSSRNGLTEKQVGFPKNQSDVDLYWGTTAINLLTTPTLTYSTERVIDAVNITPHGIDSETKYVKIIPFTNFSTEAETEYKLKFLTSALPDLSASFSPQIDVYISGSSIQSDTIKNTSNISHIRDNDLGVYIGSVNKVSGKLNDTELFFKSRNKSTIKPIFVVRSGVWDIGQIGIYPRKEIGFSPNHIKLNIPVSLFRRQTELLIHVDYLNAAGIKANTYSKIYGAYFEGNNTVITGRNNQFTGSFSGSYGGDGRELITSWSRIEGIPIGLISSSIDTSSFVRTEQTGGFATTGSNSFYGNQYITGSASLGIGTSSISASLKMDVVGKIRISDNGSPLILRQPVAGSVFNGIDFINYNGALIAGLYANQSSGEIRHHVGTGGHYPTFWSNGSEAARINTGGNFVITNSLIVTGSATVKGILSISGSTQLSGSLLMSNPIHGGSFMSITQNAANQFTHAVSGIGTYMIVGAGNSVDFSGQNVRSMARGFSAASTVGGYAVDTSGSNRVIGFLNVTGSLNVSGSISHSGSSFTWNDNRVLTSNDTSSFAIKTDITGAFTTTSSSFGTRVTTLENKVYVSSSRQNHILISNETTTGSFATEGLSYWDKTIVAPTQSSIPWGILKVEGEQGFFGEFQQAGSVLMREDVSKVQYMYGVSIPPTMSVSYYLDFPIFKNNLTGSAYSDGRSRSGVMSVDIDIMTFASSSSGGEKVIAQNWKSRFICSKLSFVQVTNASTSTYGSALAYDTWHSVATTMAGGVTVSASMLRIPCTWTPGDGRAYELKTAASCKVIKFEFL